MGLNRLRNTVVGTIFFAISVAAFGSANAQVASSRTSQTSSTTADAIERVMESSPIVLGLGRDGRPAGSGSSVLVDARQGFLVTNEHVVRDRSLRYEIVFPDGRSETAEIVGAHRATDIALLRIKPQPQRRSVPFADTQRVRVTDPVFAIGYPRGIAMTVTRGIVSAKGRTTGSPLAIESFLQTDAPISPGNSGGPLINTDGEIVGINSQTLNNANSVGFAVPAEIVRAVIDQLSKNGFVKRSTIGAEFETPNMAQAQEVGIDPQRGAIVRSLRPGGQAERAGLRVGDIVTRVDGRPLVGISAVKVATQLGRPGTPLRLEARRSGEVEQLTIGLEPASILPVTVSTDGSRIYLGGVSLRDPVATDGVPRDMQALVIESVDPGSPAAREGAEPGMIVLLIGDAPPRSVREAKEALRDVALPALIGFIPGNVLDTRFGKAWLVEE